MMESNQLTYNADVEQKHGPHLSVGFKSKGFGDSDKDDIIEIPKIIESIGEKQLTKLDILRKLSSGTPLREGLNDVVQANAGALILIENSRASSVFQGGFRVDCKFTSKRLAELSKMDGAIVLSEDFKKIIYANTLLIPDSSISSSETGTRHQAAERTAKQIDSLVIAVSGRKKEITIYYKTSKYVLQHTEDLLRRGTETLQILEKQGEVFNELLINLNILEMTNLVSVADVCRILQRIEMIKKMAKIIYEYVVELGKDGVIVRMRLRELTRGIEREQLLILKDYVQRPLRAKNFFNSLNFEELLDLENISKVLFKLSSEKEIAPHGYRMLSKTSLSRGDIESLVKNFKSFYNILEVDVSSVLKDKVGDFRKELSNLREHIMVGKKI